MKFTRFISVGLLTISLCGVIAFEHYNLASTRNHYYDSRATVVAADIRSDLATISSALQSGNQALYDRSFNSFQSHLAEYRKNPYVSQYYAHQLQELTRYSLLLRDNQTELYAIISLRATLGRIHFDASKSSNLQLVDFRNQLLVIRSNFVNISEPTLVETIKTLQSLLTEIVAKLDAYISCRTACSFDIIKGEQEAIQSNLAQFSKILDSKSQEFSLRYSPNSYILLLQ